MFVEFELPHLSVVHFGPKDAVQLFFFFFLYQPRAIDTAQSRLPCLLELFQPVEAL